MSEKLAKVDGVDREEEPYECDVCKKRFDQPNTLVAHKRIHTGEKPFECEVCQQRFSQSCNLLRHQVIHTGYKRFECGVCNKRFTCPSYLRKHEKTAHKGDQNFECAFCKTVFADKKSLELDKESHLKKGELVVCDTCGREISLPEELKHINECMVNECYDKCNKLFPNLESLNQHKSNEHGILYKCDVCQELEATEATGIGYICCICDAVFEIATDLENHIITHDR